ncbi:RHS domain-containing protein, partial [Escherichia coli]|nr:RHS domain-containing protein [Escherichia coli]HBB8537680.1 RHS domain-containing protein [Escherichia coli]
HCDHRGLPQALISPEGETAWCGEYDEWGNLLGETSAQHLQHPNTRCRRKTNATPLSISDDPPRKVTMLCAQPTSFIISLPSGYCAENGMVLSPSRHWISKMLMMIISGVVEVARTR